MLRRVVFATGDTQIECSLNTSKYLIYRCSDFNFSTAVPRGASCVKRTAMTACVSAAKRKWLEIQSEGGFYAELINTNNANFSLPYRPGPHHPARGDVRQTECPRDVLRFTLSDTSRRTKRMAQSSRLHTICVV